MSELAICLVFKWCNIYRVWHFYLGGGIMGLYGCATCESYLNLHGLVPFF